MAGIYVHIPFCRRACSYCNFHYSTNTSRKGDLINAITNEIRLRRDYLGGERVNTIYFGGGTPSLLSKDEIDSIIRAIYENFDVLELDEFTFEANPDDLNEVYIGILKSTPITRLSIGTQSFRDQDLQYMGRVHSSSQASQAIQLAKTIGFDNITVDLIYGVPGLDDKSWVGNINKISEMGINHFSAYALTVEAKTKLHYDVNIKRNTIIDAGQSVAQFEILMNLSAELGFVQYEISNFARPGYEAIHNSNYWNGEKYLGVGPGAHSYNGIARHWNIANNALYTKSLLSGMLPESDQEVLTDTQRLNELIMISLRTRHGLDLKRVESGWGILFCDELIRNSQDFVNKGWLYPDQHKLMLTTKGKLFADKIASELFFLDQTIYK